MRTAYPHCVYTVRRSGRCSRAPSRRGRCASATSAARPPSATPSSSRRAQAGRRSGAPSQLSSAANLAALRWLYEDLFWPKICLSSYSNATRFVQGHLGLMTTATWELLSFAQTLKGPGLKFDFLPNPTFPSGRATFCTADFYAIAANTQHADDCWDLLRWVSVEPTWQQAAFSYALRSPALNSLWDQWATTIQTVVPFFKGKAFSWFGEGAAKGYAYPVEYYPVADQNVWGLIGPYFSQLLAQKIPSVEQAAAQIDLVVNGFEATAAQREANLRGLAKQFPTAGPEIANVTAGV